MSKQVYQSLLSVIPCEEVVYKLGNLSPIDQKDIPSFVSRLFHLLQQRYSTLQFALVTSDDLGTHFVADMSSWERHSHFIGWFRRAAPELNKTVYILRKGRVYTFPYKELMAVLPREVDDSCFVRTTESGIAFLGENDFYTDLCGLRLEYRGGILTVSVEEEALTKPITWENVIPAPRGWRVAFGENVLPNVPHDTLLWELRDQEGLLAAQIALIDKGYSDDEDSSYKSLWLSKLMKAIKVDYIQIEHVTRSMFSNGKLPISFDLRDLRNRLEALGLRDIRSIYDYILSSECRQLPAMISYVNYPDLATLLSISWDTNNPRFVMSCSLDYKAPAFSLDAKPIYIVYTGEDGKRYRRSYVWEHSAPVKPEDDYIPYPHLMFPFALEEMFEKWMLARAQLGRSVVPTKEVTLERYLDITRS